MKFDHTNNNNNNNNNFYTNFNNNNNNNNIIMIIIITTIITIIIIYLLKKYLYLIYIDLPAHFRRKYMQKRNYTILLNISRKLCQLEKNTLDEFAVR